MDQNWLINLFNILIEVVTDSRLGSAASLLALVGTIIIYFRAGRIRFEVERQNFVRFELSEVRDRLDKSRKSILRSLRNLEKGGSFQDGKTRIGSELGKCRFRIDMIVKRTKNPYLSIERRNFVKRQKELSGLGADAYVELVWEIYAKLDAIIDHLEDI